MLGDLTRDAGHVGGPPREDVGVVTQEICEDRFHVRGHAGAYIESFLRVFRMDLDHLGVVDRVKGHR